VSDSTGVSTRIVLSAGMGYTGAKTGAEDGGGRDGSVMGEVTGWAGAAWTAGLLG
jgi:hypothetical protein